MECTLPTGIAGIAYALGGVSKKGVLVKQLVFETNGTNLSAKIPDAARINTHSTTSEKREEFRPFPFKGKARMRMGPFATFTPSPPQPSP